MDECKLARIYDKEHVGVTVNKGVLTEDELEQVMTVFESNTRQFYPLKFGSVTRWDLSEEDFERNPVLERVRELFRQICFDLSASIKLNPVYREKYSVMFYPECSSGVKPHRDSEHSVNCIVVFVMSGNNSFFASYDKECKNIVELKTHSGDAVIMRGPRSDKDRLPRPIHYVEEVSKPRFVLICRHINLDGLHK